jgi:hypothetical protein
MAADPVKHSPITLSIGNYLDDANWVFEINVEKG